MLKDSTSKEIRQKKNLTPNIIRIIFVICFNILVRKDYIYLSNISLYLILLSVIWTFIDYCFDIYNYNKYLSLIPALFDICISFLFIYITGSGNSMIIVFLISSITVSTILADQNGFYQSYFVIVSSIILYSLMIVLVGSSILPYINLLDFSTKGINIKSILSILFYITFALGTFYALKNIRVTQLNLERNKCLFWISWDSLLRVTI